MYRSSFLKCFAARITKPTVCRTYAAKDIKFGPNVKTLLQQGVDIVADAVSVTLGPKGRSVILEQPVGSPIITKDGLTIAKGIELPNKFQNMGLKLIQDVAERTNEIAGDGTTTAILLARGIAKEGLEHMKHGANPIEIRKGIIMAVDAVVEHLHLLTRTVKTQEDIEKVAILSANGDREIGCFIARAINKVGREGVVTVQCGNSIEDKLEIIDGMKLERGFMSAHFINSMNGPKVEYKNAMILLCQKKIFTPQEILPAMEVCATHKKPLIIITEDIDEDPLSILIHNKLKIGLPVACVKAPGFAEYRKQTLVDLATATGGVVFEDDTNLIRIEDCMYESLGQVDEVTITKDTTIFIGGHGDKEELNERIKELKSDIELKSKEFERLKLLERLVRLQSKIAILKIGGSSEVEINEKKDRVNDALNATRAAIDEGIVPGGGTSLVRCIPILETCKALNADSQIGIDIVKKVLAIPLTTIANNAGHNGPVIVEKTPGYQIEYGYDVISNSFVNLMTNGIMDSTKVVRQAVSDASRIASLLTTVEAVICTTVKEKKPKRNYKLEAQSSTPAM